MNNSLLKLFEELDNLPQYQIYCDLDGVLCDFDSRFEHFTGILPDEYKSNAIYQYGELKGIEKFWDVIDNQIGIRYWRGMGWMPEGKQLWDYIKKYKPIILTSPSRHDSSKEGKSLWVKDNLGNYKVEFKRADDKKDFANPSSILIDDREDNIMGWKSRNGIGFLYKGNTEEIIKELNKLGL